jgi:hypothetical protein
LSAAAGRLPAQGAGSAFSEQLDDSFVALKLLALTTFMKRYLPLIIAVAAIATLGSGAMLYRAKLPGPLTISDDKSVSREGDAESMHIRGNPEASVTLE